ncbi:unnamed protein product, partial [Urochloa humidicola]
ADIPSAAGRGRATGGDRRSHHGRRRLGFVVHRRAPALVDSSLARKQAAAACEIQKTETSRDLLLLLACYACTDVDHQRRNMAKLY